MHDDCLFAYRYQVNCLAGDKAALDYIATRIAPKLGVSAEVIARRLRSENRSSPRPNA